MKTHHMSDPTSKDAEDSWSLFAEQGRNRWLWVEYGVLSWVWNRVGCVGCLTVVYLSGDWWMRLEQGW